MKPSKPMTKDTKDKILQARDARHALLKREKGTVLVLRVNAPSNPKNTPHTTLVLRVIHRLIMAVFSPVRYQRLAAYDGDTVIYTIQAEGKVLKKQAIYIEENHPLGRLVDLDVYAQTHPITRSMLNHDLRPCFICSKPAHECVRSQRHDAQVLQTFFTNTVETYLQDALAETVIYALRKEVWLAPKFGLVSHKDSGVHTDMTMPTFLESMKALKPYFCQFVQSGMTLEDNLPKLRQMGIEAETAMLKATRGINTHKGAIFLFGAFLPHLTHGMMRGLSLEESIVLMRKNIKALTQADFEKVQEKHPLSHGEKAYRTHGIKGIRGEVINGLPSIFSWYHHPCASDYHKLAQIMAHLDDTTIIKRQGLKTLKEVQKTLASLANTHPFDEKAYFKLSDMYKQKGISPGGSADMLAVVFFLEATDYLFDVKTP